MVYNWLKTVRYALYPPYCVLCGRPGEAGRDLCRGCLSSLPDIPHACLRCGIPLSQGDTLCGPCYRHPPPYLFSHIPFRYASPLDHLLQQLKFHRQLHLATLLGELLVERVGRRERPLPECLLPVPLHPDRLRERGYNQALELARVVSRRLAIPLDAGLCRRQHATAPQTSLDGEERRRNLRGAFTVRQGGIPQHVAIIDDVVTTGTTVNELARTLRRAGVETVEVWACARAGSR
jgi:ComF family protein